MLVAGVLPDARSYASLLKGCGRRKQVPRGEAFYRLLQERNAPQATDVTVYNALINMYSNKRTKRNMLQPADVLPAWECFREMQELGVQPTTVTYNSLITMCSRLFKPDVARAVSLYRQMRLGGVEVTEVTLCALMQVLGRAKDVPLARCHSFQRDQGREGVRCAMPPFCPGRAKL